jgi:archaetidylinositol phosphate synthase
MASATRELTFLLAAPEKRLLQAIARRVPDRLRPNHFTVLGVLAATGAGAAYALASRGAGWLWLASAMLAMQWFGDSLDGTLARVRRTERPRYGYYLDHITDAYSTAAIGVGIGLSHYVHFGLALGLVVLYLLLSINVYLETQVFGTFQLGYGRLGSTEARLMLVTANTVLALSVEVPAEWPALLTLRSGVVAVLLVGMLVEMLVEMLALIVARFARNVRVLARLEPQDLSLASRAARRGAAPRVSVAPIPSSPE